MKSIIKALKSYKTICIILSILIVILLIFNLYLIKSTKIYSFSGTYQEYTILNGTIYIGHDINRFQAPHIIYNGEDLILKNGTIGYYILESAISVIEVDEELKVKDILNSFDFSFTEMHKNSQRLSKKNISDIKSLSFKISGTLKSGEKINIEIPLNTVYLGK